MTGVSAAWFLASGVNPWLAVLLGIMSGTIAGAVNGLVVTKLKINAFIATLGMLSIAQGVALLISGGLPLTFRGPFKVIGQGYVWQVPVSVILMFSLVIFFAFFMDRTVLARKIYAVGGSERAALVSGIKIDRIRIFVFTLNGTLAGLAGIIIASNLAVADPTVATGLELDVIAASVIGGASLSGGEGTVWGALLGAAIMGVLRNAFVLLNISGYWQIVVIGVFVILAVAFDNLTAKR
jgi:ribose transport system permease protein